MRKLIGHSGPVYSVAFDPVSGSAAPPRHLLSSSADGTARLWSLDTFTNLVAYRGHENPVWDVKWSPLGVYFATASRDRTARLWSTDRLPCLRLYAGHLSDVDVRMCQSPLFHDINSNLSSVLNSILMVSTLRRVPAIGQHGYGMCSVPSQLEYLLDTEEQ